MFPLDTTWITTDVSRLNTCIPLRSLGYLLSWSTRRDVFSFGSCLSCNWGWINLRKRCKKETKFDVVNTVMTITVYKSSLQDFYLVAVSMTRYANARQASNIFISNWKSQLQQALTNLQSWSHDNNIRFNAYKCKVLSITRKKKPVYLKTIFFSGYSYFGQTNLGLMHIYTWLQQKSWICCLLQ